MFKKLKQRFCKHEYVKVGEIWNTPDKYLFKNVPTGGFVHSKYQNEISIKCGKVLNNIEKGKSLVEIWSSPDKYVLKNVSTKGFIHSKYQDEICIKCGKVLNNIEKGKSLVEELENTSLVNAEKRALAERMYKAEQKNSIFK